ncbi:PQQ-binding-like beta-propeller repeat protein [Streptomyces sp. NPDC058755]|uniref:serine/threonine-protein kinase n=1 Tax=Streptomyces sp. NPDC058755 TaxID=3346624 RepID=UPI003682ED93
MTPLGLGDPLRLGPYRLLGVLGEGGMGKVYVGRDASGTVAAVKVLRPELAHDQNLTHRFLREAHTAQAVKSSGVARVLGAQLEGGRPWIASEFLSGPTLEQAVGAHGPFDETGVRVLAAALATTLSDIHTAGLVHRDLKPANIVLTSKGPRIIDFGIARPEHGLTLTTTGQVPVTPGFGAPEQVLGHRVGPAADVFSLGAVLVYAAGGRPAYTGSHVATVQYTVVHGEPDLTAVPPSLQPLIAPCLFKEPAQRPVPAQISTAFAPPRGAQRVWQRGRVAEVIKHHETQTKQYTTVVGSERRSGASRRRFLAGLGAGGALLAAGGGTTAWWMLRDDFPPAGDAPPAKLIKDPSSGNYYDNKPPRPFWGPLKVAATDSPAPLVLRDVVIFASADGGLTARKITDGTEKWALPDIDATARYVAVGRTQFAAVDGKGNLHIHDASTSERLWSVSLGVTRVLASDGSTVYTATADDNLRAVDRTSHKNRWPAPTAYVAPIGKTAEAAADDGYLVVSCEDGTVFAFNSRTGKKAWDLTGQNKGTTFAPLIADETVYLGGNDLIACRLSDGEEVWKALGTWGPPILEGDYVLSVDGGGEWSTYDQRPVRFSAGTGDEDSDWYAAPEGDDAPMAAPLIQGHSMWLVEGGDTKGVTALNKDTGDRAWTYKPERGGTWRMAAAGNRVFLLNGGEAVAMPVF